MRVLATTVLFFVPALTFTVVMVLLASIPARAMLRWSETRKHQEQLREARWHPHIDYPDDHTVTVEVAKLTSRWEIVERMKVGDIPADSPEFDRLLTEHMERATNRAVTLNVAERSA